MSSGNGGWGYLRSALGGKDRATMQRWAAIWLVLVAVGWFWVIPKFVSAQDKKEEPKPAAEAPKPAADMPKPSDAQAPAAAPADTTPKGDDWNGS